MQLKTTDTTTRLSDKDIKSITKFGFTFPRDFYELACLVQNMDGVTELLFGFNARLTVMLDNWHQFLTRAPGTTIPTLRQLAQADPSAACQLGWFIDRRMQQFLVLCASGRHEDVINSTLLDFGPTRQQQLKDGAFEYKLSKFYVTKFNNAGPPHRRPQRRRLGRRLGHPRVLQNQRTSRPTPRRACSRRSGPTRGRCSSITRDRRRFLTCAAVGT
jgi:hypothetical protein